MLTMIHTFTNINPTYNARPEYIRLVLVHFILRNLFVIYVKKALLILLTIKVRMRNNVPEKSQGTSAKIAYFPAENRRDSNTI